MTRLATRLDPSEFSPHVIVLADRPAAGRDLLVKEIEAAGVPVTFLGLKSIWQTWQGYQRLKRVLEDLKPELIQSFLFHANMAALTVADGVPVSTGVRVADPRKLRHWMERLASRNAKAIVCVSQAVADFACDVAGLPRNKVEVIANGVDLQPWPAEARRPAEAGDRQVLLCVGRLHHQKGYDWMLSQADRWLSKLPDHVLVIAGDGPDRDSLRRLAAKCSFAERIHLLGQRDDVPQLMASCDVLLLPSRWEGMPNVVLEAMASARPVLASRVEGVVELLGPDLKTEQSAAFGDEDAWGQRIIDLATNQTRSEELGRLNRERVSELFQVTHMVEAYEDLFRRLVKT